MARTRIIAQSIAALPFMDTLITPPVVMAPLDPINGNFTTYRGGEFLLAIASGVGTLTITSTPDGLGRIKDLVLNFVNGQVQQIGPLEIQGFQQVGSALYYSGSATISVAIVAPAR